MNFRIRPLSKKNNESDLLPIQLPFPKTFGSNENLSTRNLNLQIDQLTSSMNSFQQLWYRQRQMSNKGYVEVQKRLDELSYITNSNKKNMNELLEIRNIQIKQQKQQFRNVQPYSKNQIAILKQFMQQERYSQKQQMKHYEILLQQMNKKQIKIEIQFRQLMNEQKYQYNGKFNSQIDEIRSIDGYKQKKIDQQIDIIQDNMGNLENKLEKYVESKLRKQGDIKQWVQDQMGDLKQQITTEQKNIIQVQTKFVKDTKQSIQSLLSIINNFKAEITDELKQTQKILASNLKKITMTVDINKSSLNEKISQISQAHQDLESQIHHFKNFMSNKLDENREIVLQIQQKEDQKAVTPKHKQNTSQQKYKNEDKIMILQKDIQQWKSIVEKKNLNIFKQISNNLKLIKNEFQKNYDDITLEINNINQELKNIKKIIPNQIKKSIQTIITIFNNQLDIFTQQMNLLNEMIIVQKKQNQKNIKIQLKKFHQQINEEIQQKLNDRMKLINLQNEKNIDKIEQDFKNNLNRQSTYLNNLLIQKYNSIETEINEVQSSFKKIKLFTNAQLEEFAMKIKHFNENYKDYIEEQRKDDFKKRMELEQNMRNNSNSLMDICYKKCEFMVDGMKKAIEMNIMKDQLQQKQDLQRLKDEVQKTSEKLSTSIQGIEDNVIQNAEEAINLAKKSMNNEIGNIKLEMNEKINELEQKINLLQKEYNNINSKGKKDQLTEKQLKQIKQNVWKIEASCFSDQVKNKAIMDRLGDDIGTLATNLTELTNSLKDK